MTGADWLRPGMHDAIPADEYHAGGITKTPALSASIAKILVARSPLHAWWAHPQLNPAFERTEETKFDVGTAAHAILLQGEDIVDVCDYPDWRTNAAKDQRDEARRAGLIPLLACQWEQVQAMVTSIRGQLPQLEASPPMFVDGKPEQTLIWEEDNGIVCKARIDWLHNDLTAIDDLKTVPSKSGTANPHVWSRRTFWTIGADIEAYFHARGVHALTGVWPAFRFLVAECNPPHAVSSLDLAPSAWDLAQRKVDFAIRKWGWCLTRGEWPAYDRRVASVDVDAWQEGDLLRVTLGEEEGALA